VTDAAREKPRRDGPAGLAILVLVAVIAVGVLERLSRPDPADDGEATAPRPMPPLRAEGWLNLAGEAPPSPESLRGRWVVLDSWATYCGPCLRSMPHLADRYPTWRSRGVEVIGLTSEPASLAPQVQAAIDRVDGWDWPVAYGAGLVNSQLGVEMIPHYTLFDPEGVSVWRGHSVEGLEAELRRRTEPIVADR